MRDKIFAMQHGHEGERSVWVKAPEGVQGMLVGSVPERFFRPPYVGHHGWASGSTARSTGTRSPT